MLTYGNSNQQHKFHLVTVSPWPLIAAIGAGCMTFGGVLYMHFFTYGGVTLLFGIALVAFALIAWWRDVIREATFEGMHTIVVQRGLRIGVVLFIVSEVMFFFAFFWAYFHFSLDPTIEIGSVWPPAGIVPFDPWGVPLLNTYILLLSGVSITVAHYYLIGKGDLTLINSSYKIGSKEIVEASLLLTVCLAILFTALQAMEYFEAPFDISDSVYGSIFFMATGFHGFHVIVGTTFILVCLGRATLGHFTKQHHIGFEAAAWYWHFVDVVWLFLFVSVYWWGSL